MTMDAKHPPKVAQCSYPGCGESFTTRSPRVHGLLCPTHRRQNRLETYRNRNGQDDQDEPKQSEGRQMLEERAYRVTGPAWGFDGGYLDKVSLDRMLQYGHFEKADIVIDEDDQQYQIMGSVGKRQHLYPVS